MVEKSGALAHPLKQRVVIDRVSPEIDAGRFAVKRLIGDVILVEADILCDGHDELDCQLLVRQGEAGQWMTLPMECLGNDRWQASFLADRVGLWHYQITARIDAFATWLRDLARRRDAGEDLRVALADGALLVAASAHAADPTVAAEINAMALKLQNPSWPEVIQSDRLRELMLLYADRRDDTKLQSPRAVWVDRQRANKSAWYEVFPRSWGPVAGRHGTLNDLAAQLDSIAAMGFDVLYLTPIHPIGRAFRKGRNNAASAADGDVGSPWAIGAAEGGHTAIHSELGTFADFERLRRRAEMLGMELALDLAVQCSPDHPWVREHPEWFRHRSDGTIQYAENPPKKYRDIVPFDFQCDQRHKLWDALGAVVRFWVEKGVKIFRVDNPHTKPFAFWEWLITDIHRTHPEVLFLAEAFTRPKTMYRLAKLGFTQSYTYFTWRVEKQELSDYLREVTTPPIAEFFRPNFWPNTPDILHHTLQNGGRAMFQVRLALAALTVGNWGIYGPAMELLAATPRENGSEEYLDSEKYEIKVWHRDGALSLASFITQLNAIRSDERALSRVRALQIEPIGNDALLAWSRYDPASGNRIVIVVNLHPDTSQSGLLTLNLLLLDLVDTQFVETHDLLTGSDKTWSIPDLVIGITIECTPLQPVKVFRLTPLS